MKIINDGLPLPLYRAVSDQREPVEGNIISVTQLIGPPQIRHLLREHWDFLEEKASSRIWLADGNSLHALLEKYGQQPGELAEHSMSLYYYHNDERWEIIGTCDHYDIASRTLTDYKRVGVATLYGGVKPEWEAQLNLYAYLMEQADVWVVSNLQVAVIYRDWIKSKAGNHDYPDSPFATFPVRRWSNEETEHYIDYRLTQHATVTNCTPDDQWARPSAWAVHKAGQKRAYRVVANEGQAVDVAAELQAQGYKTQIIMRPGVRTRCESYCPVANFCPQYAKEHEEQEDEDEG